MSSSDDRFQLRVYATPAGEHAMARRTVRLCRRDPRGEFEILTQGRMNSEGKAVLRTATNPVRLAGSYYLQFTID